MKKFLPYILITLIPLIFATILFFILPSQIPIHLSINGDTNYASKAYVFLLAFLPLIIYTIYKIKK